MHDATANWPSTLLIRVLQPADYNIKSKIALKLVKRLSSNTKSYSVHFI